MFKVLNSDGLIIAAGYTRQIGIMNWQDIGFGLSLILSIETIVKMFARETPVIVWINKKFLSSKSCYPVQRFLYVFNVHFVGACAPHPHVFLYFVYKTLLLVSYSQKFFECGPGLLFNIQREREMQ